MAVKEEVQERQLFWTVLIKRCVARANLPEDVRRSLIALMREIEICGPVRGNWPNYGKLSKDAHHCHIKKGKPAYVAVWEVRDKKVRIIEVTYAGTHEKSPY